MFLQLSRVSYSRCFRCLRMRLSQQSLSRILQRPSILETFHLSISATIRPTISRPNFLAIFIIARRLYLYFFVLPFRSHARLRLHFSISIGTAFHRRKLLFTMLLGYSMNDLEIKRYRRHDRRFTSGEIEGAINVIADIHSRARTISSKVRVSRFSPSRNQR